MKIIIIPILVMFVPKGKKTVLVQVMVWHWTGYKLLAEHDVKLGNNPSGQRMDP